MLYWQGGPVPECLDKLDKRERNCDVPRLLSSNCTEFSRNNLYSTPAVDDNYGPKSGCPIKFTNTWYFLSHGHPQLTLAFQPMQLLNF